MVDNSPIETIKFYCFCDWTDLAHKKIKDKNRVCMQVCMYNIYVFM